MNECLDCGYKGKEGLWLMEEYKGIRHLKEEAKVYIDSNDKLFDLNFIDAKAISSKYNICDEEAESFIMNGFPICPKCKSEKFYILQ